MDKEPLFRVVAGILVASTTAHALHVLKDGAGLPPEMHSERTPEPDPTGSLAKSSAASVTLIQTGSAVFEVRRG